MIIALWVIPTVLFVFLGEIWVVYVGGCAVLNGAFRVWSVNNLNHTVQWYCYGFLVSLQNQLNIYFVTSRQYRLGIVKLKNVFRSFLTHLLRNFKNFLSNFLLTDWLTKRNSILNRYSYSLDFFTVQRCFIWRCAFSPTAAAPMLASWFYTKPYLCSPLYSIPFSFTA